MDEARENFRDAQRSFDALPDGHPWEARHVAAMCAALYEMVEWLAKQLKAMQEGGAS